MQKFRKNISFLVILNLLLFSAGQAYILSYCECNHSETKVESTNCCSEVVEIEIEESSCCETDSSNDSVKFESTTSHACDDCSTGCSVDENIEYTSPTLFASISFSLNKLDRIKLDNIDYGSEKLTICDVNNKLTRTQNNAVPKLFGKNLLIKTHSLKIPLILV